MGPSRTPAQEDMDRALETVLDAAERWESHRWEIGRGDPTVTVAVALLRKRARMPRAR